MSNNTFTVNYSFITGRQYHPTKEQNIIATIEYTYSEELDWFDFVCTFTDEVRHISGKFDGVAFEKMPAHEAKNIIMAAYDAGKYVSL